MVLACGVCAGRCQWRYAPTIVLGQPVVEVDTEIDVIFSLVYGRLS